MKKLNRLFILGTFLCATAFADKFVPQATNLFYHSTPGVLRPDEGTLELRVKMKREHDKTYNPWDILFSVPSAQPIGKAVLGIFIPPIPDQGLRVVFRDGVNTRYLQLPDFTWTEGKPFVVALSWGKALRLYIDGKKVAEVNKPSAIPDHLMSSFFRVDQADRFNTESIRLSSTERAPTSLWTDTSRDFSPDGDTTLLATGGLSQVKTFTTAWSSGHHTIKPIFQERYSILDTADDPVYPLVGMNATKTAKNVQVRVLTTDTAGISNDFKATLVLPAESPAAHYFVPLPALKKSGYYKVASEITIDGVASKYQSTIAVFPVKAPAGKLSHWLGQHYEEPFDLGGYDKAALKTLRVAPSGVAAFSWPKIEPKKGEWDWSAADEFVADTQKHQIEVIGILGNVPRWAAVEPPDPAAIQSKSGSAYWKPRSVEEFGNYVFQTVSRYKGRVAYWEIWNEVDWHPPGPAYSFTGSTDEYLALLKEAYVQAKRADPACKVLISGFGMFGDANMPKTAHV